MGRWTSRKVVLPATTTTLAWGAVLGLTAFLFQVIQGWVDSGISKSTVRWLFPATICASLILAAATINMLILKRMTKPKDQIVGGLAQAVIGYAQQLHDQNRLSALVTLRNNFSETIHILGFHDLRVQLGELSLRAATVLGDDATKAAILIDDLGWANYLLRHDAIALENINRGIEVATEAETGAGDFQLRFVRAKGLRHKALIKFADEGASASFLTEALDLIESLNDKTSSAALREIAQIDHANAFAIAMRLGVHKTGFIRQGDKTAEQQLASALTYARSAAAQFLKVRDEARYTKTLFLLVRLLEAGRRETEAREVRILRDRALAHSDWSTDQGIATVTGVS